MKGILGAAIVLSLLAAGCSKGELSNSEQSQLQDKLSKPVNSPGNPGADAKPAGPPSGGPPPSAAIKGDKVTD